MSREYPNHRRDQRAGDVATLDASPTWRAGTLHVCTASPVTQQVDCASLCFHAFLLHLRCAVQVVCREWHEAATSPEVRGGAWPETAAVGATGAGRR